MSSTTIQEDLLKAISTAQSNYFKYYKSQKCKENRGYERGWLTWFRHTAVGQKKAMLFMQDAKCCEDANDIISLIEDLLKSKKTAFHIHSFSSYLLDELLTLSHQHTLGRDISRQKKYGEEDAHPIMYYLNQILQRCLSYTHDMNKL